MSNVTTLSGAELRALATAGDAAAIAEQARRVAKREASGKVTVAALRSWGRTDEANAIVARAKEAKAAEKAAKPAKAEITPVIKVPNAPKATAFTRTHEAVEAKSAVGHLHNRMCAVEKALMAIANTQAHMLTSLDSIAKRLG